MSPFEEFLAPRLERRKSDEASRVVFELWDGRRLEDAVLDAIESLPASKTKRLRRWVDQAQDFAQWFSLERQGWNIIHPERHRRVGERVLVESPSDWKPRADFSESIMQPLAAAIGVNAVVYVGKTTTGTLVFEVLEAGW